MPELPSQPNQPRSSSFFPFFLIAVSLIAILGWQLWIGQQARTNGRRLREQQVRTVEESKQIQRRLELIARDLVNVSQNDHDASALVAKYHISFHSPTPAPATAASPAASP
jgi:cytoskeletal protein RodZ